MFLQPLHVDALDVLDLSLIHISSAPEQPAKEHWAKQYYDSLIAKGVRIDDTRFDDKITRGEVFALLDRIVQ